MRRARREVKRMEWSLECQICRDEPWGTATGCGHLFGTECIKHWLEVSTTCTKDDEGYLVLQEPSCPVCRVALSEKDLKRVCL